MSLVNDGVMGVNRVLNNPLDGHPALRRHEPIGKPGPSTDPIAPARRALSEGGVTWNEGVVGMHIRSDAFVGSGMDASLGQRPAPRATPYQPMRGHWMAMWVAFDPDRKLFPGYGRHHLEAPEAMADLSVEVRDWALAQGAKPFRKRIGDWGIRISECNRQNRADGQPSANKA